VAAKSYRGLGGLRSFMALLASTLVTEWPRPDIPGKDPYTTRALVCPYDDSELVPFGGSKPADSGERKFRCVANGHLFPQLPTPVRTSSCPYDGSELIDDGNGTAYCQAQKKHYFVLTPGSRS
jgi:hypothetical protein